jgi:hypothetical protein
LEFSSVCGTFGGTNPLNNDTDADRFLDGPECALGTLPGSAPSKPLLIPGDDGDGMPAAWESIFGTNPNDPGSDDDGLRDDIEALLYRTSGVHADTDTDGCSDGKEAASVNGNRSVEVIDLQIIAGNFRNFYPAWDHVTRNLDFTRNGHIDVIDLGAVAAVAGAC